MTPILEITVTPTRETGRTVSQSEEGTAAYAQSDPITGWMYKRNVGLSTNHKAPVDLFFDEGMRIKITVTCRVKDTITHTRSIFGPTPFNQSDKTVCMIDVLLTQMVLLIVCSVQGNKRRERITLSLQHNNNY